MTGIMMSISTMSMSGVTFEGGERLGAALGDHDVGVAAFEQRRQREDVAEVVVDDEDLAPSNGAVGVAARPVRLRQLDRRLTAPRACGDGTERLAAAGCASGRRGGAAACPAGR